MKKTDYGDGESIRGEPDVLHAIMLPMLAGWVKRNGRLPPPFPDDFGACVAWWTRRMQEPQRPDESREAYALRCRSTLHGFLSLPARERECIIASVRDDRVPYRGDSFAVYLSIIDETYEMRRDPEAYRRETMARLSRAIGRKA